MNSKGYIQIPKMEMIDIRFLVLLPNKTFLELHEQLTTDSCRLSTIKIVYFIVGSLCNLR